MRSARVWPIAASAALGILILVGLGVWQLQRLSWKTALIASIETKATTEPISLSEALEREKAGEDIEFLKVADTATFNYAATLYMLASDDGKPAWRLITPYISADGTAVLVDRGVVPEEMRDPAKRPDSDPPGPLAIIGQIGKHSGGKGAFTPANDPVKNIWYWWDEVPMLVAAGIETNRPYVPFILHLSPQDGQTGWPRPQALDANLRNNHLGYALTWFGLAIVLSGVAGLLIRSRLKPSIES
jgi:surfeit locus 1 family protein